MTIHLSITNYTTTAEDMLLLGRKLAKAIDKNAIIFLYGSLGAGKTTFTRGFLRELGYLEKVKSPTYTLVEPYNVAGRKVYHFDLYRLTHAEELEHIGIEEYFTTDAICLIEWPEKGFPLLPIADVICTIDFNKQGRKITIEAHTHKGEEILRDFS